MSQYYLHAAEVVYLSFYSHHLSLQQPLNNRVYTSSALMYLDVESRIPDWRTVEERTSSVITPPGLRDNSENNV